MSERPRSGATATGETAAREILDLVPDAVLVIGADGRIEAANRAAEFLTGRTQGELLGRACTETLTIRDAQGRDVCDLLPVGRRMPVSRGVPERDYELVRESGEYVPVSVRCAYERDERFVVRRMVCTLRDIRVRRGMDVRTAEVISTVSHEIRSPLTSIKGFTKTLLDRWERFEDDMKREMLQAVNTDADRVTRLLGELLDVSRLEAGRLRLRTKSVEIPVLVDQVVAKLAGQSEAHQLATDFPEDFPPVVADPDKLQQILTNLLENALKYTEDGRVLVSGRVDGGHVRVDVSDEGEGIPQKHLPRLFRKFYRRERAGSPTGTGLGLYICKGLIEAHGGRIDVRSAPGAGTTFTFTLPVRPEIDIP